MKSQRKEPPEDMSNFLNPSSLPPLLSFIFPYGPLASGCLPPRAASSLPPSSLLLSLSAVQLALSLNIEGMKKNGAF